MAQLNTNKRNASIKEVLKSHFVSGWNFGSHTEEEANRENMTKLSG